MPERTYQTGVGHRDSLLPIEPAHLLALPRRRGGVGVASHQQVADVEVGVAAGAGVNVDMHQTRPAPRVVDGEAGLLPGFPMGRGGGGLASLDVASRLQPQPQPAMEVQDYAAGADDDGRRGDVGGIGVLVEGTGEPGDLLQQRRDAGSLPVVDGVAAGDGGQQVGQTGAGILV